MEEEGEREETVGRASAYMHVYHVVRNMSRVQIPPEAALFFCERIAVFRRTCSCLALSL